MYLLFWQYLRGIYDTTVFLCKWELLIFYMVAVSIHARFIVCLHRSLHVLPEWESNSLRKTYEIRYIRIFGSIPVSDKIQYDYMNTPANKTILADSALGE